MIHLNRTGPLLGLWYRNFISNFIKQAGKETDMLRKSTYLVMVILGMSILLAGTGYAKHHSYNWATVEYPAQHQLIPYGVVKIVVQLEEGADLKTFKAKLNKKKVTDQFDYDDYRNRLTATLGPEDGLNVIRKRGTNTLETEIKGYKGHNRKKDRDFVKFYMTGGPAPACADLVSLDLPDVAITSAADTDSEGAPLGYCQVDGVIETGIGFEVKLPADWNGKFYMGGGGGFVGDIQSQGWETALPRGYATAGTDTGHKGTGNLDGSAFLNDDEAVVNWAYRAVQLTASTAKFITRTYYNKDIKYSYFSGCSTGGRQGMMEAQRFPKDFDGIISGAPAIDPGAIVVWAESQSALYPDPYQPPTVPFPKVYLIEDSVLTMCDALDGVEDDLLSDPLSCDFDLAEDLPMCPDDIDPGDFSCFTTAEIEVLKKIYGYGEPPDYVGPLAVGYPFGGEIDPGNWDFWVIGDPALSPFFNSYPNIQYAFTADYFKYLFFNDAAYDFHDFDPTNDDDMAYLQPAVGLVEAVETDLRPFKKSGGKLIMWNGWSDPCISPLNTINYYEAVLDTMGARKVDKFFRFYLVPGVGHCGGGRGPGSAGVDFLTALENWVESGIPPESIPAYGGDVTERSRPLCPYPQVAVWDGVGNPDDAASFTCQEP